MTETTNYLWKIYRWALLAPALLPLFFVEGMMYPLMAPKTLALRALGVLALALFSYLALDGRPFFWHRLRNKLTLLPAALLAVGYVASFAGVDFYRSFWSTFERGDGLLTLSVCIGFFYLILLSADASFLSRLYTVTAWVGSLAALYLLIQWVAVSSGMELPFIVPANGRVGGTLGNAAFFAAYEAMAFFATLAVARTGKQQRFWYTAAALELIAILVAATRGTILALALIGLLALAYAAWHRKTSARIALGTVIALGVLFIVLRGPLSRVPFTPVARLASISLTDPTTASRLFIWRNMAGEIIRHPLGVGAEHIPTLFDRFYDPTKITEEWFDRSHNVYLDYAAQFGILGLLLYLAVLFAFARSARSNSEFGWFALGALLVYALQNIFVFDTGVTLWLLFALGGALLARQLPAEPSTAKPLPYVGMPLAIALLFLIWPLAITPWRTNLLAFESYLYQIVDVPRASAAAQKVLSLGTYADLELGYNAYFMYTEEQRNRLSGNNLGRAYDNAVDILTRNFYRFPYDARTAVYLAQVLSSPPPGVPEDQKLLAGVLARAIEESPKRAQPWYIFANVSIGDANRYPAGSKGRSMGYEAAKDILKKYIGLVPALSEPHFILAQLEYASQNKEIAAAEAKRGRELYTGDLLTARRAAQYYETVVDLPNAAFFLREILRFTPNDENAAADLAQVEAFERANK